MLKNDLESPEPLENLDEAEVLKAIEYLQMKDDRKTVQDIAEHWGYATRKSVYDLLDKWRESGVLAKARRRYLTPKAEEIQAATSFAMSQFPDILQNIVEIAKGNNKASPRTSLEAAAWLYSEIIKPELAQQEDPGISERNYAERLESLKNNPTQISTPNFLKKSQGGQG